MRHVCICCGFSRPQRFDECPKCEGIDTCKREKETKQDRILRLSDVEPADEDRTSTGRSDWDQALNGGLTKNMVVLVPGKPGFGKTTEILRIAHHLGTPNHPVALGTSERPTEALALRAKQLGVNANVIAPQRVYTSSDFVDFVEETRARHVMLDSWGGFGRSRSVDDIKRLRDLVGDGSIWIVCHVTKAGDLAGESDLEHEVDATVWVRRTSLRTSKNWHGPAPLVTRRLLPPSELRPTAAAPAAAAAPQPARSRRSVAGSRLRVVR